MVCTSPLRASSASKRCFLFVCLVITSLLCCILQLTSDASNCERGSKQKGGSGCWNQRKKYSDESDNRRDLIQFERIQHFRKQCESHKFHANISSEGLSVLYSEKYKLAYKMVPKVGSTFMIQVYNILTKNVDAKSMYKLSRNDIHDDRVDRMRKIISLADLNTYTVLIMARNPYSRLYSGYIDKVFILNTLNLCKDILSKSLKKNEQKDKTRSCKFDISFEEFLEYYFDKGGTSEQGHYGPIITEDIGRKICSLKRITIVKQESFTEDIKYALDSVNVKGNDYDTISGIMNSKNTESTIRGIVKTVYSKFTSFIQRNSCLTWKDIATKLWKSFQIQGYIHEHSEFPNAKFTSRELYKKSNYLVNVIMKEVNTNPLTHLQKIEQRNKALLSAYSGVNKKYFLEIQKRYAMDFDMFQYGTSFKDALH